MGRGHQLWVALMLSHICKNVLLSSKLQPLLRGSRWLPLRHRRQGCSGADFSILCSLTPSILLSFVLFFPYCAFINVAPFFYTDCLFNSPLVFLFSNFQHFSGFSFLSSNQHFPCLSFPSPLYSTQHFILYPLSLVLILLSALYYLFSSPPSILWTYFKAHVSTLIKTRICHTNILPRNPDSPFIFWYRYGSHAHLPCCYSRAICLACDFTPG